MAIHKATKAGRSTGLILLALALALLCGQTLRAAPPRRVAILVGVNQYEKRGFAEHPLQFAERDVTELARLLEEQGFKKPRILTGSAQGENHATKQNIQNALADTLKGLSARDIVLIALAGHGEQIEVPAKQGDGNTVRQEDAFFCPIDAEQGEPESLISLTALVEKLDRKGGVNLLLVDACREDPSRGAGRAARGITGNELKGRLPSNTAILFGCSARQQALETDKAGGGHGVFFFNVLAALRGEAANQHDEVTWGRLANFVQENVNQSAIEWFPERAKRLAADEALQMPHQLTNLNAVPILARVSVERGMASPVGRAASPLTDDLGRSPHEKSFTNSIGMKLTLIPAGEFMMGSPDSEKERSEDEGPRHRVRITKPFYLGVYEVTQAEYERVMGENPSYFSSGGTHASSVSGLDTGRFPVESVSWEDAVAFCEKLSDLGGERAAGRRYRLPTEAEWEYACRAGTTTPFSFGSELSGREANCYWSIESHIDPCGTAEKGG